MEPPCTTIVPRDSQRFGAAGSLVLHGVLLFLVLVLVARHPPQVWTSPPAFVPVDLLLSVTGTGPFGPKGPAQQSAPHTPKTEAASLSRAAVSPEGKHNPEDALEAKLKAFARLRQPNQNIPIDAGTGSGAMNAGGGNGGYALRDYVRAQILKRWSLSLAKLAGRTMLVEIRVTLKRDGRITAAEVVGGPADKQSEAGILYRDIAISARNAALLASPVLLPSGDYPAEMHFTLTLNPQDTVR